MLEGCRARGPRLTHKERMMLGRRAGEEGILECDRYMMKTHKSVCVRAPSYTFKRPHPIEKSMLCAVQTELYNI